MNNPVHPLGLEPRTYCEATDAVESESSAEQQLSEADSGAQLPANPESTPERCNEGATPGPLQKALRAAGLPDHPDSFTALQRFADKVDLPCREPQDLLKVARKFRKWRERGMRLAHESLIGGFPVGGRAASKKLLKQGNSIPSGRQWKRWKKAQQRAIKANGGVIA